MHACDQVRQLVRRSTQNIDLFAHAMEAYGHVVKAFEKRTQEAVHQTRSLFMTLSSSFSCIC